jgi:hypothetical protein
VSVHMSAKRLAVTACMNTQAMLQTTLLWTDYANGDPPPPLVPPWPMLLDQHTLADAIVCIEQHDVPLSWCCTPYAIWPQPVIVLGHFRGGEGEGR